MSGIDRDLNQLTLFKMPISIGRMRNLSGRAAELVCVEVLKKFISPDATCFTYNHLRIFEIEGFRPDICFTFMGDKILFESKSVKKSSKLLIRMEQHRAMLDCDFQTLYGFVFHTTSTRGMKAEDILPTYLREAVIFVTTAEYISNLLEKVGKPYKHSKDNLFKDPPPAGDKSIKIGWQRYNWMEIPGNEIFKCKNGQVMKMSFTGGVEICS